MSKKKKESIKESGTPLRFTVTFYAADTLTNVVTGEQEDYESETDWNKPMYLRNYIVKTVESEYGTITYDHYHMIIVDGSEELSLKNYLIFKLWRKKSLIQDNNDIYHCPDTNETLRDSDIIDELKLIDFIE